MVAGEDGDGDARPAIARQGLPGKALVEAEHLDAAAERRDQAADDLRPKADPIRVEAQMGGEARVGADDPAFEAAGRAEQVEGAEPAGQQGQHGAKMNARSLDQPRQLGVGRYLVARPWRPRPDRAAARSAHRAR